MKATRIDDTEYGHSRFKILPFHPRGDVPIESYAKGGIVKKRKVRRKTRITTNRNTNKMSQNVIVHVGSASSRRRRKGGKSIAPKREMDLGMINSAVSSRMPSSSQIAQEIHPFLTAEITKQIQHIPSVSSSLNIGQGQVDKAAIANRDFREPAKIVDDYDIELVDEKINIPTVFHFDDNEEETPVKPQRSTLSSTFGPPTRHNSPLSTSATFGLESESYGPVSSSSTFGPPSLSSKDLFNTGKGRPLGGIPEEEERIEKMYDKGVAHLVEHVLLQSPKSQAAIKEFNAGKNELLEKFKRMQDEKKVPFKPPGIANSPLGGGTSKHKKCPECEKSILASNFARHMKTHSKG